MINDFLAVDLTHRYLNWVDLHHHDFFEMYFFCSGNLRYKIENYTYDLVPGDILIISPTELHQPIFNENGGFYHRIVISLSTGFISSLFDQMNINCFDENNKSYHNLYRFEDSISDALFEKASAIASELNGKDEFSKIMSRALINELLVSINRSASSYKGNNKKLDENERIISDIVKYINCNLSKSLSLDLIADQFFISKFHLLRLFNDSIGTTVYRYITQRRLMLSKQLMLKGGQPTKIFKKCGFNNYTAFYCAFKSEYQMAPREFYNSNSQKYNGI